MSFTSPKDCTLDLTRLSYIEGTSSKFYQMWALTDNVTGITRLINNWGRISSSRAGLAGQWSTTFQDSTAQISSRIRITKHNKEAKGYTIVNDGTIITEGSAVWHEVTAKMGITWNGVPEPKPEVYISTLENVPALDHIERDFVKFKSLIDHGSVAEAVLVHARLRTGIDATRKFLLTCEGQLEVTNVLLSQLLTSQEATK